MHTPSRPHPHLSYRSCHADFCPSCSNPATLTPASLQVIQPGGVVVRTGACALAGKPASAILVTSSQCSLLYRTGRRRISECGEQKCYVEVRLGGTVLGALGWVQSTTACGTAPAIPIGAPVSPQLDTATCQQSEFCCAGLAWLAG